MIKSTDTLSLPKMEVKLSLKADAIANDERGIATIGALWDEFFKTYGGTKPIIAIYDNYSFDHTGSYDFHIGTIEDSKDDATYITKEGSYYAVEVAVDDPSQLQAEIGKVWNDIWNNNDLKRLYIADFEIYKSPTEVTIYVGVAE